MRSTANLYWLSAPAPRVRFPPSGGPTRPARPSWRVAGTAGGRNCWDGEVSPPGRLWRWRRALRLDVIAASTGFDFEVMCSAEVPTPLHHGILTLKPGIRGMLTVRSEGGRRREVVYIRGGPVTASHCRAAASREDLYTQEALTVSIRLQTQGSKMLKTSTG